MSGGLESTAHQHEQHHHNAALQHHHAVLQHHHYHHHHHHELSHQEIGVALASLNLLAPINGGKREDYWSKWLV